MNTSGRGRGFETTRFMEERADSSRPVAAVVFWQGGGFIPDEASGGLGAIGIGVPSIVGKSPLGMRLALPFLRLIAAIVLRLALAGQAFSAWRAKRRRKPHRIVPMSAAVREARQWARYKDGVLQINARKFPVPDDATLVVFVEDDPSQDDDLAITTHLVPSDSSIPGMKHPRSPTQMMLAIHQDAVCREFLRRVDPG